MVKFYSSIDDNLADFIRSQSIFFVASAPLAGRHVNVSPKGHPKRSFAILGKNEVAYLDGTGSGAETVAHVYENGRVTVMFCSFGRSPRIMRLFCTGRVVEKGDQRFEELRERMSRCNGRDVELVGGRAIILLHVFKVQTSCGFGVPVFGGQGRGQGQDSLEGEGEGDGDVGEHGDDVKLGSGEMVTERETMDYWARKTEEKDKLLGYQRDSNFRSLDGLPGLRSARRARGQWILVGDLKAWVVRVGQQWEALLMGGLVMVLVMASLCAAGVLDVNFGSTTFGR